MLRPNECHGRFLSPASLLAQSARPQLISHGQPLDARNDDFISAGRHLADSVSGVTHADKYM